MKRHIKTARQAACLLIVLLMGVPLFGCAPEQSLLPDQSAQPTEVPIYPVVPSQGEGQVQSALYFRYMDEPYLITQTRDFLPIEGESPEAAALRELLSGPSAEQPDARAIVEEGVTLEEVRADADASYLEITLSEDFIYPPTGAPSDWQRIPSWADSVYASRRLAVQAMVNTVTELGNYASVQLYIQMADGNRRLLRSEVGMLEEGHEDQPLEPISRQPDSILTPERVVLLAMDSISRKDMSQLDNYIEGSIDDPRHPPLSEMENALVVPATLNDCLILPASLVVSNDGQTASLSISYLYTDLDGFSMEADNYTLWLTREKEVWRLKWSSLQRLYDT